MQCIRSSFFSVFIIVAAAVTCFADSSDTKLPFPIGETIEYKVRWEMVAAGRAKFQVLPHASIKDKKALHFLLTIKSNRYIDMLYKIRDEHEGFTDPDLSGSLFYKKVQKGKDKRDARIIFNDSTARYVNFGSREAPIKIPPGTFDPLSAFYKMRAQDFKTGKTLSFPVTNGKKYFFQKAKILKKETINVSGTDYETFVITLAVNNFSGVFEKSENPGVTIWTTADNRKIPVRIKIKVFIGSVVFDLAS